MGIKSNALHNLVSQLHRVRHLSHLNFMNLLHTLHHTLQVHLLHESQSQSMVVMPTSTAHPVQVNVQINIRLLFRILRGTNIDNKTGVSDINTPCDDVSSQKNVSIIVSKSSHDLLLLLDSHLYLFIILVFFTSNDPHSQRLQIFSLVRSKVRSLYEFIVTRALKY